jgi:hypothetical protein
MYTALYVNGVDTFTLVVRVLAEPIANLTAGFPFSTITAPLETI